MSNSSAKILVVDDNPATLYATSRVLKGAGFNVLEAETGEAAISTAQKEIVDLVVLDVNLPDIDGFEVCRRLRRLDRLSRTPVIHLSATFVKDTDKVQGLEGLIAKRRNSVYEPGLRSGAWLKMRVNVGQEFVIGGYTLGGTTFDALVFGYYDDGKLIYAARTRNGFTPTLRADLMKRFKPLEINECPFANLPEKKAGRWGVGLTAAKMGDCQWLKPVLVGQFEFVEWTQDAHLRHSRFMGLREDKRAEDVRREV